MSVVILWLLNSVAMGNSMLVATSLIATIPKPLPKEIGVTCPICGKGQVIERKTKRNRIFYGCDRYPECEFTSWDLPVGRSCPKSGDFSR